MRWALLCLSVACSCLAAPAWGAAGVSCHCFRDRTFDPARPAAADPYILATAQNTLLSAVAGVEKKSIVQAKMLGTPNEDLWVAHFVAGRTGLRGADLLAARGRVATWRAALADAGVSGKRVGGRFGAALAAGASDGALASAAVDAVLAARLGAPPSALQALRAAGAGDAEAVAAAVLAARTGRAPAELYRRVASGETSWGELFRGEGVAPADVDEAVRALVR
ncbi:MAG: hypothetical protein Kow0092_40600 [Deferrisomatales bacterium]